MPCPATQGVCSYGAVCAGDNGYCLRSQLLPVALGWGGVAGEEGPRSRRMPCSRRVCLGQPSLGGKADFLLMASSSPPKKRWGVTSQIHTGLESSAPALPKSSAPTVCKVAANCSAQSRAPAVCGGWVGGLDERAGGASWAAESVFGRPEVPALTLAASPLGAGPQLRLRGRWAVCGFPGEGGPKGRALPGCQRAENRPRVCASRALGAGRWLPRLQGLGALRPTAPSPSERLCVPPHQLRAGAGATGRERLRFILSLADSQGGK